MVMVGAGVVYATGNSLNGAFVRDLLKLWVLLSNLAKITMGILRRPFLKIGSNWFVTIS